MTASLTGDSSLVLPEFDSPPADPLPLLREWMERAEERAVSEPRAVTLSTADVRARPSSRTVLLRSLDATGLTWGTSAASQKGAELAANPQATIVFYWRELLQQVIVSGGVEKLGETESDLLFDHRTRDARAATAVSRQGGVLEDEAALRSAATSLAEGDSHIPRPDDWFGYRLVPTYLEFWYGSPDRLHRRLAYSRADVALPHWSVVRLQP